MTMMMKGERENREGTGMFSEAFSPSAGPENRMAGACKHGVMLPLCMCQRERAPFVVWREGDKAEAGPDYHGPKVKLSTVLFDRPRPVAFLLA